MPCERSGGSVRSRQGTARANQRSSSSVRCLETSMYMRAWENQSAFRDPDESRSNFRLERTGYAGRSPERGAFHNHFILTRSAELHSSTHDQLLRRAVLVYVIHRLLLFRGAAGPAWWISSSGSARRWPLDTEAGA